MTTKLLIAAIVAAPAFIGTAALTPATAAPIDHCKPVSACTCGWGTLNGKRVYICTPKTKLSG
jgi:hypothetical protein